MTRTRAIIFAGIFPVIVYCLYMAGSIMLHVYGFEAIAHAVVLLAVYALGVVILWPMNRTQT